MQAAQSIKAGDNQLVLAGGFESMTGAPYFAKIRDGAGAPKFGPMTFEDHMQYDGLRCAFECWAMGNGADYIAKKYESPAPSRTAGPHAATPSRPRRPRKAGSRTRSRPHRRAVQRQEVPRASPPTKASAPKPPSTPSPNSAPSSRRTARHRGQREPDQRRRRGHRRRLACSQGRRTRRQAHRQDRRVPHQRRRPQGHLPRPGPRRPRRHRQGRPQDVNDIDLFELNEAFAPRSSRT
jgi:hypothetical protein